MLAEKIPTINFHEIFQQKFVQCGYQDVSDEIDAQNDMGEKIHAGQIKAKLLVSNPEDMGLVEESPIFVTEETELLTNSDMKLPLLKLDFKNMFYATCRAKLNYEINIRFEENPQKQFGKKFDSNEFMVKLKGDKFLFDSAMSKRYVYLKIFCLKLKPYYLCSQKSRVWKYSEEVTKTDQLVVIVGSTGTGKSTLIEIMTGQDVETSGGAKSVTRQCQLINSPDSLYYWLDSVGWEDR